MLTLHIPKRCMMISSISEGFFCFFFAHIPTPCSSMTLTLWSTVYSWNFCFLSRVVHLNFTGLSVPVKAFPAVKSQSSWDTVRSIWKFELWEYYSARTIPPAFNVSANVFPSACRFYGAVQQPTLKYLVQQQPLVLCDMELFKIYFKV